MTLKDCIEKLNEVKEAWPNGINFKNKSKFLGFSLGDICLSIEQLESKDWGIQFESLDKEFNSALNDFFEDFK